MKTIIAGSRTVTDYNELLKAISGIDWEITQVISGTARGVDKLGEKWARENNVQLICYYPDWKKHGKRAGIIRNVEMVEDAEALLALWDGKSKGVKHTIDITRKKGLKVFVYQP